MAYSDKSEDGDIVESPAKVHVPEDVQEAIRTLIRWAGDDPSREGLLDTPKRVARAWKEYCQGYSAEPAHHLSRTLEEVGGGSEEHTCELQSLMRISYAVYCMEKEKYHVCTPPTRTTFGSKPSNQLAK